MDTVEKFLAILGPIIGAGIADVIKGKSEDEAILSTIERLQDEQAKRKYPDYNLAKESPNA